MLILNVLCSRKTMSIKSVLMLSMLVLAVSADDDQAKINAAQTILTLTNSLVQIKNLLTGNIILNLFHEKQ